MSLVAYGNNTDEESDEYDSSEGRNEIEKNENVAVKPLEAKATLSLKLPIPKTETRNNFIEEDDEFLHKKAVGPSEQPPQSLKRNKVKIVIPALQKKDENAKSNKKVIGAQPNKPTGLLNLLPKPAFGGFKKSTFTTGVDTSSSSVNIRNKESNVSNVLVPHSVAKNVAHAKKSGKKNPTIDDDNSDSGDSSENDDFFSFHTQHKLPEVSQNEINDMVAKKTAEMKRATTNYLQNVDKHTKDESDLTEVISEQPKIDEEALKALCGSGAKRARRGEPHNVVIELSGDQVLPNRDEWLRNQLQSKTEYQPRGMVDDEPGAGTRKKHQITYLAKYAKANEQELQAMWAANRHTRRQTQKFLNETSINSLTSASGERIRVFTLFV